MAANTASWVGQVLAGGRYRVTGRLGEGGMGFVFKAWDKNLETDVVIKVPRWEVHDNPEMAGRFAQENRSLVRLAHPHIVKVLDVGEHDGFPFAVMQFLPGGSLRGRLEAEEASPAGRLAGLSGWLRDVAAALDFIHGQGYIHRDVKPDNILFDAHGLSYLSDFGIAKVLADGASAPREALTGTGMVLGTPQYMAPELLLGKKIDGRVDQYALAVTVYQAVSGKYPYDGPTPAAIFVRQAAGPPPLLEKLVASLPRDLSAAVQKGLAKDPAQRYPDCLALSRAVLATVVSDGPATDRATPVATRAGSPDAGSTKIKCAACGAVIRIPASVQGKRMRCPSCRASLPPLPTPATAPPPLPATVAPSAAETQPSASVDPTLPAFTTPKETAAKKRPVLLAGGGVAALLLLAVGGWGVVRLTSSPSAATDTKPEVRADATATPSTETKPPPPVGTDQGDKPNADNAGTTPPPSQASLRLAFPAEIKLIAGKTGSLKVRLERRGLEGPVSLSVEGLPDLVTAPPVTAAQEGKEAELVFTADAKAEVAVTPVRVVAASGDVRAEKALRLKIERPGLRLLPVAAVRLTAGQKQTVEVRLQRIGVSGPIKVWLEDLPANVASRPGDIADRQSKTKVEVAASPSAEEATKQVRIVAKAGDVRVEGTVEVIVEEGVGEIWVLRDHLESVTSVAFSPDGRQGLSGGGGRFENGRWTPSKDNDLRLWNLTPGQLARRLSGHREGVQEVTFAADGRRALSAGRDRAVRLWDVATGQEVGRFLGHADHVNSVAFHPDGRTALSAGNDGNLRVWDLETGREERKLSGHRDWINSLSLSADGRRAVSASADSTVRLWDVDGGKEVRRFTGHRGPALAAALVPGADAALSGGVDKVLRLWDLATGKELRRFEGHTGWVFGVAVSADGRRALSTGQDGTVRLWDLATGQELHQFTGHSGWAVCVAISHDGRRALSGGADGTVRLWSLPK